MLFPRILSLALIPYVLWLVFGYEYHLIDGANLLFHEAGHHVFGLLGETMHFLGGTLGQFVFPIACAWVFWSQGRRFEPAICGLWLGESVMYMAEYLGDAQAQALPLVGGHIHDWNWLLTRAGLLEQCRGLALAAHVLGSLIAAGCLGFALWIAFAARIEDPIPATWSDPHEREPRLRDPDRHPLRTARDDRRPRSRPGV